MQGKTNKSHIQDYGKRPILLFNEKSDITEKEAQKPQETESIKAWFQQSKEKSWTINSSTSVKPINRFPGNFLLQRNHCYKQVPPNKVLDSRFGVKTLS